jgi:sialate O-acetylesterase
MKRIGDRNRLNAKGKSIFLALPLLCLAVSAAQAKVSLPHVFGNDMVLQRDVPIAVWGWAEPGEQITVSLGTALAKAAADEAGDCKVVLPAAKAGGPLSLTVAGTNTVTFSNVLIGEVWFCMGQQNFGKPIADLAKDKDKEIAGANDPSIRFMAPQTRPFVVPLTDAAGQWSVCAPNTARQFPAVPYFFARELRQKLGVPVGVIVVASTAHIDQFTSADALGLYPDFAPDLKDLDRACQAYKEGYSAALDRLATYVSMARRNLAAGAPVDPPPQYRHLYERGGPAALFNGTIAPFTRFAIRGFIWQADEPDSRSWNNYAKRQEVFIRGLRGAWNQNDLPFYFVQMPPGRFDAKQPQLLAQFWADQAAAMKLPGTGMVVLNDLPNPENRLPDKPEVGRRLALWALAKTYGNAPECSGPIYQSSEVHGNKVVIHFTHDEGLAARDGKSLSWFTISAADKNFVPAIAVIVGKTIEVSAPGIGAPSAVRFAWDQTAQPNLTNKAGLPADPFRTDE